MSNDSKWTLWPQLYRDLHGPEFSEAMCEHGVGHHEGVHGCDGCCSTCPPEIWAKVTKE